MVTIKEVFESDNWIITEILQGNGHDVRINARRRFPVADESFILSKWCSVDYANRLAVENYGKKIDEFRAYRY